MSTTAGEKRVYRGSSLSEILPRIHDELGPDAIILREREGLVGGIRGFFARRCFEVEAAPGWSALGETTELLPQETEIVRSLPASTAMAMYEESAATSEPPVNRFMEMLLDRAAALDELFVPEGDRSGGAIRPDGDLAEPTGQGRSASARPVTETPSSAPSEPRRPAEAHGSGDEIEADAEVGGFIEALLDRVAAAAPAPVEEPRQEPAPGSAAVDAAPEAHPVDERAAARELLEGEEAVRGALARAGMSTAAVEALMGCIETHVRPLAPTASTRETVRLALLTAITTPLGWDGRPTIGYVALDGAPAVKAIASLASAYAAVGSRVAVLALGSSRLAARLAAALVDADEDVDVLLAPHVRDVEGVLADAADADLVLALVTPALEGGGGARAAAEFLAALDPDETHLVVPAGCAPERLRDTVDGLAALHPVDCLLPSSSGLADDVGAAVGVALQTRLSIRWVAADGAGVRVHPADAAMLAEAMLP